MSHFTARILNFSLAESFGGRRTDSRSSFAQGMVLFTLFFFFVVVSDVGFWSLGCCFSLYFSRSSMVERLGGGFWRGGLGGVVSLEISHSSYFPLSLFRSGGGELKLSESEE